MTHWLTVAEAAEYIRAKTRKGIDAAIEAGDLPCYRYEKSEKRLKAEDIDAWMEGRPWEPRSAS